MNLRKIVLTTVLFTFAQMLTGQPSVSTDATADGSADWQSAALEIPLCHATLTGTNGNDHEAHTYSGFTLCYRESYEQSEWVAYTLTREKLNAVTGRSNDFKSDTKISTESASPKDYTRSGYDRGHLAPAADMEWSITSVHESFLMSNMSPQAPQFNRGLWKTLEEKVRDWADKFGTIYVVTGPVLEKDSSQYDSIGANKVSVPEYFYKAILAPLPQQQYTAIAFILPNKKCEGTIFDYAVTVDQAEERTSLDFYSALPDEIENVIEASFSLDYWN